MQISEDFPGDPVAKTLHGAWIPSLVKELDLACFKIQHSQINKYF